MRKLLSIAAMLLFSISVALTQNNVGYEWGKNYGSASNSSSGSKTITDASGNTYTVGKIVKSSFEPLVFPCLSGVSDNVGNYFLFISKHNAAGDCQWVRTIRGDDANMEVSGVALDPSGNIFITGYFSRTLIFGDAYFTTTSSGGNDVFVGKYSNSGDFLWAKNIGGTSDDRGISLATDASGNVYTTGTFRGTVDFDPGSGVANLVTGSGSCVFVSKLDASGNYGWAKILDTNQGNGTGIALDASGNVYTTGSFSGSIDFDPSSANVYSYSSGSIDVFISKLDASGNYVWGRTMGGSRADIANSICLDASGNIYTTGYFNSSDADFDPSSGVAQLGTTGINDDDVFISKLNASGNYVWAKKLGGPLSDIGRNIKVDASGNVYTTGVFQGTSDFDPGNAVVNLSSAGGNDIFVSKLDASGNYVWAKTWGGTGDDNGNGISVDASGNIYTTGSFKNTVDFDPNSGVVNLAAIGNDDIFLSKLSVCPALTITTQPTSKAGVCLGGSTSLSVSTTSTGTVSFQWKKDGVNIAGANANILTISNITAADIGTYTVDVTNVCTVTSNPAIIALNSTATLTPIAPTRCGRNGYIDISNVSGYVAIGSNDCSTPLSNWAAFGSATVNNGEMQLTPAMSALNGGLVFTPPSTPPAFLVSFDLNMYINGDGTTNEVADGMSFNYGVIPASPTGSEEGILSGNGLVVRFKEYKTQRIEIVYNGVVKRTLGNDLHYPTARKVQIAVTADGKLSMRLGDSILVTNLDLGTAYSTDNKSTWSFGWGSRTGATNNRHAIDNIFIYDTGDIQFSTDNFTTKQPLPFFGLAADNYTIKAQSNNTCSVNLGTTTIPQYSLDGKIAVTQNYNCTGNRTINVAYTASQDNLVWSDFATRPTLTNVLGLGNAVVNGTLSLTTNNNDQSGAITFEPSRNTSVFTAKFKTRIWDGSGADGISFNFGIIDRFSDWQNGMMQTGSNGLSICFLTYGTQRMRIKYKDVQLGAEIPTSIRFSNYTPFEITVNAQYKLTIKINGTTVVNGFDLSNTSYATDDHQNWRFGIAGFTGGSNDNHNIDDLLITGQPGLLYSFDGGTTYVNNNAFSTTNLAAMTVKVKADGGCAVQNVAMEAAVGTVAVSISPRQVCANVPTTITATPTGTTGTSQTYQWYVEGNLMSGENSNTLYLSSPYYDFKYSVKMTPNGVCVNPTSAYSDTIYVGAGMSTTPLASGTAYVRLAQQADTTYFANCSADLMTKLVRVSGTPQETLSGKVKAKVWVESTQSQGFVKRHYEITPEVNTNTAKGRVTLYFTQPEFDDFNAVNAAKLPTGTSDAAGKANLRIEKRSGISNDNTGLPSTYDATPITIDPDDADILWSAAMSRWEVTFNVTGFSGFFVKTPATVLPLDLTAFIAQIKNDKTVQLNWLTANEVKTSHFDIERSTNGVAFVKIETVKANGKSGDAYSTFDKTPSKGINYYRLKMVDNDGTFAYSKVISVNLDNPNQKEWGVYPNPTKASIVVEYPLSTKAQISVLNVVGQLQKQITTENSLTTIQLQELPAGMYFICINTEGTCLMKKIVKE